MRKRSASMILSRIDCRCLMRRTLTKFSARRKMDASKSCLNRSSRELLDGAANPRGDLTIDGLMSLWMPRSRFDMLAGSVNAHAILIWSQHNGLKCNIRQSCIGYVFAPDRVVTPFMHTLE